MIKKRKRGMELEMLGWLLLGLGVLVAIVIGYFILSGKGINALHYVKNLFRFGK